MTNRIRQCIWHPHDLGPTLGKVSVGVFPERVGPRTEVRGQLTGPRCAYATTIEVAYPLHEAARTSEDEERRIVCRVAIPEPSLWEPQTPFLYEGTVELWDDGQLCDRVTTRLGLRDFKLGSRGFLLNGRPFAVHGVAREEFIPEDLPALRQTGFDTLLTPLTLDKVELWDAADRLGFFVIGWLADVHGQEASRSFNKHPSCLGVVVAEAAGWQKTIDAMVGSLFDSPAYWPVVGLELTRSLTGIPTNNGFSSQDCFLFCDESLLPDIGAVPRAVLVRLSRTLLNEAESQALLTTPGVCGWVLDPSR